MSRLRTNKMTFSRREFMATAGAGTAALFSPLALSSCKPATPVSGSDRPAAAVIGLGNRGSGIALWQLPPFADVLAVCDVDRRRSESLADQFYKNTGRRLDIYEDYRKLLDRQDIQLIGNATPEHWHTKINVDACRAGKDVYTEKPMTLTIDEGKILRRVIGETGRIVQVGTQQRSGTQFQGACSLARNGRIGKLNQVVVFVPGGSIAHGGPCTEEPVPEELNWDIWSGQAPLHPYCEARFQSAGRWWDYGGGMVTNWGTHHMDIAHWGMGGKEMNPISVEAQGYGPNIGKEGYPDQFMPFAARLEYPGGLELWFISIPPDPAEHEEYADVIERVYAQVPDSIRNYEVPDDDGGVLFSGDRGSIFAGRAGTRTEGVSELDQIPLLDNPYRRWVSCCHYHTFDFVNCINTRQQPISNAIEQHRTQLPCHLVNIALRVGRKLSWDADSEEFIDDSEANAYLKREQREPYRIKG